MRVDFLGCSVDILTMAETVERAKLAMRERKRVQHVALNVAKFVNMRSDGVLHADVMGSDVIGIDGMGILLALRLFGVPVAERVTGSTYAGRSSRPALRPGSARFFSELRPLF